MTQNLLIKRELQGDPSLPARLSSLWAEFEKAREDTKHAVQDMTPEDLTWKPHAKSNSVGMLLFHLATVELDWMVADVARQEIDPRLRAELLLEVLESTPGSLVDPGEQSVEWFVAKLDEIREVTRRVFHSLGEADLSGWRGADRPGVHYEFQVEWILVHLIQHEAGHRGQIQLLNSLRKSSTA